MVSHSTIAQAPNPWRCRSDLLTDTALLMQRAQARQLSPEEIAIFRDCFNEYVSPELPLDFPPRERNRKRVSSSWEID